MSVLGTGLHPSVDTSVTENSNACKKDAYGQAGTAQGGINGSKSGYHGNKRKPRRTKQETAEKRAEAIKCLVLSLSRIPLRISGFKDFFLS